MSPPLCPVTAPLSLPLCCLSPCPHPCICAACHQEDNLPSAEAALILHRKGFDCGLEAKNLGFNCTTSQGKVSGQQPLTREVGSPWASQREGGRCGHVFRAVEPVGAGAQLGSSPRAETPVVPEGTRARPRPESSPLRAAVPTWECARAQRGLGDGRPCLACRHQHGPAPALHGQVALGSLFHGLDVGFLQPTSLTLLYPLAAPANSTDLYLEPMEVATFRLRLG